MGIPNKNGKRPYWDLWGSHVGAQGIMLAPGVAGLMHVPFTQLVSEGPVSGRAPPTSGSTSTNAKSPCR